jgi:hypothetical protein
LLVRNRNLIGSLQLPLACYQLETIGSKANQYITINSRRNQWNTSIDGDLTFKIPHFLSPEVNELHHITNPLEEEEDPFSAIKTEPVFLNEFKVYSDLATLGKDYITDFANLQEDFLLGLRNSLIRDFNLSSFKEDKIEQLALLEEESSVKKKSISKSQPPKRKNQKNLNHKKKDLSIEKKDLPQGHKVETEQERVQISSKNTKEISGKIFSRKNMFENIDFNGMDKHLKDRIFLSVEEVKDHSFLAHCGMELFLRVLRNGDLESLAVIVPALILDWHVKAEKMRESDFILKKRTIPITHDLMKVCNLIQEKPNSLVKELDRGLLYSRYPFYCFEFSPSKKPRSLDFALSSIQMADEFQKGAINHSAKKWIKILKFVKKITQYSQDDFNQWLERHPLFYPFFQDSGYQQAISEKMSVEFKSLKKEWGATLD